MRNTTGVARVTRRRARYALAPWYYGNLLLRQTGPRGAERIALLKAAATELRAFLLFCEQVPVACTAPRSVHHSAVRCLARSLAFSAPPAHARLAFSGIAS